MQIRLVRHTSVRSFAALLGVLGPGPDSFGDTSATWRLPPGRFPPVFQRAAWGKVDVSQVLWDPARPLRWDTDPGDAWEPVAVPVDGWLVERRAGAGWRCYEAPGSEPLFIAGAQVDQRFSLLAWADEGLPAILPSEAGQGWLLGEQRVGGRLGQLPRFRPELFRSWPIRPPDALDEDGPAVLRPRLD